MFVKVVQLSVMYDIQPSRVGVELLVMHYVKGCQDPPAYIHNVNHGGAGYETIKLKHSACAVYL